MQSRANRIQCKEQRMALQCEGIQSIKQYKRMRRTEKIERIFAQFEFKAKQKECKVMQRECQAIKKEYREREKECQEIRCNSERN